VLQALRVGIVGAQQVALAVQGGTLAAPALGPVGLDLGRLLGILQGVVPLLLGGVRSGPVAVEDVVFGLEGNGLGELVAASLSARGFREGRGLSWEGEERATHMASSKFFSAMALLPRALSSSAEAMVVMCLDVLQAGGREIVARSVRLVQRGSKGKKLEGFCPQMLELALRSAVLVGEKKSCRPTSSSFDGGQRLGPKCAAAAGLRR